jgi:hypothetical protein
MESGDTTSSQHESPTGKTSRRRLIVGGIVVLGLAVVILWAAGLGRRLTQRATYTGGPATFSGSSQKLTRTVIVPTLDSPCAPGKNVIWCSSFQLAWNEVKDKVIGAPLQVVGAEEVAARLNAATQSASDLDPKSFYIAAGWIRDGIVGKIKKEMAARFPSHVLPDFSDYDSGILSYAYLNANVPFKYPFRQVDEGIRFTDSQGIQTPVDGFGLWKAFLKRYKGIREQVEVLYAQRADRNNSREIAECALDLCCHSEPYQVVVARVEPRGSLAEMFAYVRTQLGTFRKLPDYEAEKRFGANDEVRIPEMFWRIDHRIKELIDKMVANSSPPMPIVEALETIEFRLDRSGTVLESDSTLMVLSSPRYFNFNRPFLVYIQKRGAEQPFFVMWVDNDELLRRR